MFSNLILIEHDGQAVKRPSLGALGLGQQLGGSCALLILGSCLDTLAESLRGWGADAVLVADDPALTEPLADRYAEVVARTARQYQSATILGTSSTFTKDILPRVAALLDAPMVSDVTHAEEMDGQWIYTRPVNAGSANARVTVEGSVRVLTARGTSYPPPAPSESPSSLEKLDVDAASLPSGMQFESRADSASDRPDLTEARVVVCGGRPLQNKETFDRLIGGLADVLQGAVGATRAAVDAGMAPNDWQVGQTGKNIAPDLYLAVGVSGAIQHLAGIQDSKVIVAINRDPEAPIFQIANYGLVGDLHELVPRLIEAFRSE